MRSNPRRREPPPAAPVQPLRGRAPRRAGSLPASLHPTPPAGIAPGRGDRLPLPTDPGRLPPLAPGFLHAVERALDELRIELAPETTAALEAHARLLVAWNRHINLTAIRTDEAIALEHVADSLAAVPLLREWAAGHGSPVTQASGLLDLLDLGSGGGYPGIPLATVLPARHVALVESIGKKAAFLRVVAAAVGTILREGGAEAPDIVVVAERAEALASDPAHRGAWDVVTARAVAALPRLAGLAMPFLRPGGVLVAWKRDTGDGTFAGELQALPPALERLRIRGAVRVEPVRLGGLTDHRLVVVEKGVALLP